MTFAGIRCRTTSAIRIRVTIVINIDRRQGRVVVTPVVVDMPAGGMVAVVEMAVVELEAVDALNRRCKLVITSRGVA